MPKDPICGMTVLETAPFQTTQKGEKYFFCSARCQKKFIGQEGDSTSTGILTKTMVSLALLVLLLFLTFLFSSLQPLRHGLFVYLKIIWWAVTLGLFLGGLIDYYIPKEYISSVLAGSSRKTLVHATLLGFLASACSHGILALSMALYKKGASAASVVTFLLASPWANLSVTFLLLGLFGLKGWVFILSAMGVALVTGVLFQGLSRRGWVERNPNTVSVSGDFSIWQDFKKRLRAREWSLATWRKDLKGTLKSMGFLSEMVLPWVLLGVVLAGAVSAFIPKEIFHRFFGPTPLGLLSTLVAATAIETCSEGSSPLAFELYRSTGAFGNSFVFLMAGVITDYTEISLLWANIGKRTALWTVLLTIPQVLLLGALFNTIF
ncbi:MAG: permease [Candidatus Omnitrophica bacterium]|nr:permease [Candidatus Omnitrophota bacterium]